MSHLAAQMDSDGLCWTVGEELEVRRSIPMAFLNVGVASRSLMFLAEMAAARGRRWPSCAGCRGQDSASGM